MKQVEILREAIKAGMSEPTTADEWKIALLTSIAESLAIIADHMAEEDRQDKEEEK